MSVTIKTNYRIKPIEKTSVRRFVTSFMKNHKVPKLSAVLMKTETGDITFLKLSSKTLLDLESQKVWVFTGGYLRQDSDPAVYITQYLSVEVLSVTLTLATK